MGREIVFANIRKRMIAMIVGGVILTLMGGFISFAAVVAGEYSVLILGLLRLRLVLYFLYLVRHGGRTLKRAAYSKPIPIFYSRLTSFTPTYNIRTIILSYPTGCLPTRKCHSDVLARGSLRHLPAHSEYEFHQLHQRDNRLHEAQEECTAF